MKSVYRLPFISLLIMLIALAVRLPALDVFFTADEFLWVDRSRNFLGGLLSPEFDCLLPFGDRTNAVSGQGLACTLRTGHPGVVTMWTGSVGLWLQWLTRPPEDPQSLLEFVQQLPTNPVDQETIGPVRLPSVLLTTLFIGLFYLLLCQMFAGEVALLAALLLALNPFHIALSRVLHHDALSTNFIIISTLSLIIYFGLKPQRRWLILAGVTAGLAMLTKSTGFFLIPYTGLLALWSVAAKWGRSAAPLGLALWQAVIDGGVWIISVVVTFFAVWPAMWVIPWQAINTIYVIGFKYASGGHAKGVLFWDDVSRDPGPFFYPVTWVFRTTPWVVAGLLVTIGLAIFALRRRKRHLGLGLKTWLDWGSPRGFDDKTGLLLWVAAFLFFFMIAMTLGEKKQDRYILPIYPLLDLVAAIGLLALIRQKLTRHLVIALVLIVNLSLLLPRYPYYFSYYNPLVGGINAAVQTMTVGWGEGLNLAAAYLNSKPNAKASRVATWYGSTFAPFFTGETIRYSDQKGNALGGDYVVFYLNQRQRNFPDGEIWRYFNENFTLDHTIELAGTAYAWIFTGPSIGHYVEDQHYQGIAELLGWDWRGDVTPDDGAIMAGQPLPYALFWAYLGKTPEEDFFLRLIGPDNRIWVESRSQPTAPYVTQAVWRPGQIIEEEGTLHIPPETPPGTYHLQIGFYTAAPAVTSGELTFPTAIAPLDTPLQTIEIISQPLTQTTAQIDSSIDASILEMKLLSLAPLHHSVTDEALTFDLVWMVPDRVTHDYQAAFSLLDETSVARWHWSARPLIEFLPTSQWPVAIPLRSQWQLPLTAQTPGGAYQFQLQLLQSSGQTEVHHLGEVILPGRQRNFSLPEPMYTIKADFEQKIALLGLDINDEDLIPAQALRIKLHWQAQTTLDKDYTVFLQLLGPTEDVIAQQDKSPQDGQAPTSTWTPQEIISDTFVLPLSDDLPVGEYRLITGFYQFESGQRLAVVSEAASEDFVLLHQWIK